MEKYTAKRDRILVQEVETGGEEMSPGGIYVPERAQDNFNKLKRAIVISVGPGTYNLQGTRNAPDVTEGDTVVIGPHAGAPIKLNGQEYLSIVESDIHGVISAE